MRDNPLIENTEKEYVTDESLAKVQKIFKEKGSNAWFDLTEEELMPEGAKCEKCGCTHFKKETDIMDVWFDSGSTHESVLAERGLPEETNEEFVQTYNYLNKIDFYKMHIFKYSPRKGTKAALMKNQVSGDIKVYKK